MRNPKELALAAVLESLQKAEVKITADLEALLEDLINEEWESRNRQRMEGKDEVQIMKLIKGYIARQGNQGGQA
jgi:hypothetical protein